MCLDPNAPIEAMPQTSRKHGYKVFCMAVGFGGEVAGLMSQYFPNAMLPEEVWLSATPVDLGSYVSGFHIFLSKKAAQAWRGRSDSLKVIRRVEFKHPMYKGRQMGYACIVASEMKILEEENNA